MAALQASRFRSRGKHVVSNRKNSRFIRGRRTKIRSVPILGRQNKKARQILTDLSGCLATPNQHHRWSGNNSDQNFVVPSQSGAKLNIFCTVLQEFICVDDSSGHVVHRQPFRHRLAANAFVGIGFAQSLAIHQDRLGLLDSLKA